MSDIALIDIEASGLHFDSYPIEIAIRLNGQYHCWLIKPEPTWTYWCEKAQSLHGINRQTLINTGLPAEAVVDQLEGLLKDYAGAVYSDASHWDADWIDTLYHAAGKQPRFHIGSVFDLLADSEISTFKKVKSKLENSPRYVHHRAESDVRLLAKTIDAILGSDSFPEY